MMTTIVDELGTRGLPFLVCVSPDPGVREKVARQLDGGGIVLMCPDVSALRALLTVAAPVPATQLSVSVAEQASSPAAGLVIDVDDHQVRWRGTALPLTRLEVELIAQLATPPMRVWPYDRLFAAVWDAAYLGDNSILHSAVKRLRRKLRDVGNDLSIDTVRGIGYRLVTA
jgi:two-component system, OmpR family, response regulator MtrA